MQNIDQHSLFESIIRNSEDAIIAHDLDGIIRTWNHSAAILFGYAEQDALGMSIRLLLEHDEYKQYENYIQRLVEGSGSRTLEIRGLTRQGRHPDLWLNASVINSADGRTAGVAVSFRDITEHKSIESKLIALIESTPDPFIIVEANGTIQRVNRQAEVLFGFPREEMIGNSFKMLVPERFRAQHDIHTHNYHVKPMMRQMGSGLELCCLTKSGEEVPVEIGLSPVVSRNETTVMVRFHDIRMQKQEQLILKQARQKADEDNRTKSRFLAAASHDLRQPLQSISMNLGVLSGNLAQGERERVIAQAQMSLDSTNKLLNSLLNITKLESGKVQPEIENFAINDLLERVYNTESQQARERQQKFSLEPSSAVVNSDPALLEQIITNLVANAIRYTPSHGHILLGCRRLNGYLKIQVVDDGPGIASNQLDLIFDEYRQLEHSGKYPGKGLGLGLSIVKLIAELLDLRLEVKSVPGKGSSFSVLVPVATGGPNPRREHKVANDVTKKLAGTLLLIDDDAAVLDSTSLFLEVSGFTVYAAHSAAEALEIVTKQVPDLIITDYGLGEKQTGLELLDNIRKVLKKKVPAIVVTGDTSLKSIQASSDTKFDIISKPVDSQLLLQLVRKRFDG